VRKLFRSLQCSQFGCNLTDQCFGSGLTDSGSGSSILGLNTNPDPDPGFWQPKFKKIYRWKKCTVLFLWSKITIYLSLGLHKGRQATGDAFIPHQIKSSTPILWVIFDGSNLDSDPKHWSRYPGFGSETQMSLSFGSQSLLHRDGPETWRVAWRWRRRTESWAWPPSSLPPAASPSWSGYAARLPAQWWPTRTQGITYCMFKIDNIYFYLIVAVPKSPTQMGSLSVKKNASEKFSRLGTFNRSGTVGSNLVPKLWIEFTKHNLQLFNLYLFHPQDSFCCGKSRSGIKFYHAMWTLLKFINQLSGKMATSIQFPKKKKKNEM